MYYTQDNGVIITSIRQFRWLQAIIVRVLRGYKSTNYGGGYTIIVAITREAILEITRVVHYKDKDKFILD